MTITSQHCPRAGQDYILNVLGRANYNRRLRKPRYRGYNSHRVPYGFQRAKERK